MVFEKGLEISRCRLVTPGEGRRLVLMAEDAVIKADGKDLAYVRIVLQDDEGNRLTQDEREVSVEVSGAGTFLAVGSGNPCTEDQITGRTCHLYRGTAIVILKSKEVGAVQIKVMADDVVSDVCIVRAG